MAEKLEDYLKGDLKDLKDDIKEEVAKLLGMEAWVYGYPLVIMDVTRAVMTAASTAGQYGAPINEFTRLLTYVNPDFKNVVRISRNGLWSTAFVDLDEEPFVVSVPEITDRYYVMQACNMWTDNFCSVGPRTTGTVAANFLITGPKWNGTAPADVKQTHRCSTRFTWVLIQTMANGPKDFPEVIAIENQYKLTPLSAWGRPYTPPANVPVDTSVDTKTTPFDQVNRMDAGVFLKRLATLMKDNPPYPADGRRLWMMKKIGIEPGGDFDISKVDPAIARGLNQAVKEVQVKIANGPLEIKAVNGWVNPLNLGRFGTDYNARAAVAWLGLGALWAQDAVYPSAYVDGDGKLLEGTGKYALHLEKDQIFPSHVGIWSVSVYSGNFYVVNAINRYAIAPWMPLKYNADGSLDIYLQSESPGPDKEPNWLPSPPTGPINVTVRVYWPEQRLLDGSYKIPPLRRVQ